MTIGVQFVPAARFAGTLVSTRQWWPLELTAASKGAPLDPL